MNTKFISFLEKGWELVQNTDSPNPRLVSKVKEFYAQGNGSDFFYSLLNLSTESTLALSVEVCDFFKERLSGVLPGYKFVVGSFLAKPRYTFSDLYLHQDWSYTDEDKYTPITCWMPLIDTDRNSGGLVIVEGSHLNPANPRSNSLPTFRIPFSVLQGKENLVAVETKLNDILLFHPKVWHGSYANPSEMDRIVLTCIALPKEAPFLYYHQTADSLIKYEVPENGFELHLKELVQNRVPQTFKSIFTNV
jgi:hypothetical protein